MTMVYSTELRAAKLNANSTIAGNNARLRIYTGTKGTLTNLLVELPWPGAFASVTATGTLTVNSPTATNATGTGTAGWFRVVKADGTTVVMDGDVGTDMTLNTTSITTGVQVSVTSWTITAANP